MERVDQEDRSIQCDRREPTIHVDSSVKLVTIPGVGKPGNLTRLDAHPLIRPQISPLTSAITATAPVSC